MRNGRALGVGVKQYEFTDWASWIIIQTNRHAVSSRVFNSDNLNAEILEFVVNENSKVTNYKIKDLDFPRTAIIGGVIKEGKGIIALGDYTICAGDRIVVCCLPRSIKRIESLFL